MGPRTTTRLATAGFVTTVATLALAAPTAYADPAGGYDAYQESAPVSPAQARQMQEAADAGTSGTSGVSPAQARLMQEAADAGTSGSVLSPAQARLMQEAADAGSGNTTHRTFSVHPGSEGPTPAVPDTTTGTTVTWDLLPIATGAAGGILLVSLGFALVVVIRRHHEHGMAHPA